MPKKLINKINEMNPVNRRVLFAGVELLHSQINLPRHSEVLSNGELISFCKLSTSQLSNNYDISLHELSDLYKFQKDYGVANENSVRKYIHMYCGDQTPMFLRKQAQ